jgi:hypothetical protein
MLGTTFFSTKSQTILCVSTLSPHKLISALMSSKRGGGKFTLYKFINQPTTAQLFYNLKHVSVAIIRPSSGRMLFSDKQRMIRYWMVDHYHLYHDNLHCMLILYAKTSVDILHKIDY